MIKTLGRWESVAHLQYVRMPREQLFGVSSQLAVEKFCIIAIPLIQCTYPVLFLVLYASNVHLHGCEVQWLEIYVALGEGGQTWRSLPGPVWRAPLHRFPPPPWRPTFPGLSITLEGWGEGVAWPTLLPYYTDYSVARFLLGFTGVRVVCQGKPR